jgi:hypothetical protein
MRCLEIVYGSVTGAHELKIFSKERFVEIKSQWYSSVKQLVNEVPQCDRKKISTVPTNKTHSACSFLNQSKHTFINQ